MSETFGCALLVGGRARGAQVEQGARGARGEQQHNGAQHRDGIKVAGRLQIDSLMPNVEVRGNHSATTNKASISFVFVPGLVVRTASASTRAHGRYTHVIWRSRPLNQLNTSLICSRSIARPNTRAHRLSHTYVPPPPRPGRWTRSTTAPLPSAMRDFPLSVILTRHSSS